MKYDSKKNKFAARILRIAALFTLLISSGLFVQAQGLPLDEYMKRQQNERKMLERNRLITLAVGGLIEMLGNREKRDKPQPGRLKPVVSSPAPSPLFAPIANPSASSLASPGGMFDAAPPAFTQAPSLAPHQSGGSQDNLPANANSSPSGIQAVQTLNVAGNLGNGTFILADAAGKLYSARIAAAPRRAQPARRRARRARR